MTFRPPKKPALTLDASLVQDDIPLEIIPKVFIGSIHSAFNSESLNHHGITHILNASRLPITFPKLFTYLSVEIRDRDSSNILSCIPTTNIFIEAGIENGGVLIHCFGGKSRSAAFVCAYMMSSLSISFEQAYSILKSIRPIVDINSGFEYQLRAYYIANYDVYIAQQLLLRLRIRNLYTLHVEQPTEVLEIESLQPQSDMNSAEDNTSAQNTATMPEKGLFLDNNNDISSNNMDIIENNNFSTSGTSTKKTLPSLRLLQTTQNTQQCDSFYGLQNSPMKNTEYKATGLPKLTTQLEDPMENFQFSKTRSISDVYQDTQDPCLDHINLYKDEHSDCIKQDDEENETYELLQRKLYYIADSPSSANLANPLSQPSSTTSIGITHGFGCLSTTTPNKNTGSSSGHTSSGHTSSGHTSSGHTSSNSSNITNLTLNTTTAGSNTNTTSTTTTGLGAKLSLGLNIGTTTTSEQNSPADSENKFHAGTSSASKPNFMQGSGHTSGNRTHRAGMLSNRNKAGRKGRLNSGNENTSTTTSSSSTTPLEPNTPTCRLSRPGSSVVRIIPPLRGLERQFRCSWCNIPLFTSANIVRTDIEEIVHLLETFSLSLPKQSEHLSKQAVSIDKFSVEEFIAQEKLRLGRGNDDVPMNSGENNTSADLQTPPKGLTLQLSENSPYKPTGGSENSPRLLPHIQIESKTSPLPSSRRGSKDEINTQQGKLPPLLTKPSSSGSGSINSRNNSSGHLQSMSMDGGSGEKGLAGSSGSSNMDVEDAPGMLDHSGKSFQQSGKTRHPTTSLPQQHKHDAEDDCIHMLYTPKMPVGGMRTARAAHSKAFAFDDVPLNDASPVDVPMKHADLLQSNTDPGAAILTNTCTSSPLKMNLSINTTTSSTTTTSGTTSNVRRNSHDGSSMMPAIDSTISSARSSYCNSAEPGVQDSAGTGSGERSRHNSNGQLLPMLRHSKTTPIAIGVNTTTTDTTTTTTPNSSSSPIQGQPPTRLASLNIHTTAPITTAGIAMNNYHTPTGSNSATFLHGLHTSHTSSPLATSSRSDDSPSPRIHIPPHRQHQQQYGIGMNKIGGFEAQQQQQQGSSSPRGTLPYQPYPRPQSAEKRRWIARMNLLGSANYTGTSSNNCNSNASITTTTEMMDVHECITTTITTTPPSTTVNDDTSMCVDSVINPYTTTPIATTTTTTTSNTNIGALKVARLAEADDAAVRLIYSGPEKYFYIEYLEWMGGNILQPGVENADIACPSCKNVLGNCIWNPSKRLTMGGKLEGPLFRIHKDVVHQGDLLFDSTPSSTPRVSEHSSGKNLPSPMSSV